MKKPITTSLHGYLDYGSAVIIATSPWVFFIDHVPMVIPVSLGLGLLIVFMSLLTRYEGGLIKMLPMKVHLIADVFVGVLLALSPWAFGFAQETFLFQVIMGVAIILVAFSTSAHAHTETT